MPPQAAKGAPMRSKEEAGEPSDAGPATSGTVRSSSGRNCHTPTGEAARALLGTRVGLRTNGMSSLSRDRPERLGWQTSVRFAHAAWRCTASQK